MIDQAILLGGGFYLGFASCLLLVATANRLKTKPIAAPTEPEPPKWQLSKCGRFVYTSDKLGDTEVIKVREAWAAYRQQTSNAS